MSKPKVENFERIAEEMRRNLMLFMPPGAGTPLEFLWPEEYCPHCQKEPSGKKSNSSIISFSGFYYREENVFIYYWLCPHCAKKLPHLKTEREQQEFSKITEKNLINAWETQKPLPC